MFRIQCLVIDVHTIKYCHKTSLFIIIIIIIIRSSCSFYECKDSEGSGIELVTIGIQFMLIT